MKDMIGKVISTFKNYYVSILFFMIATTELMIVIYNDYYGKFIDLNETKFIMVFIYGAILALVINHIIERLGKYKYNKLLYLLVPILMIVVYIYVLGDLSSFTHALRYFITILLTSITLFAIPFIGNNSDSEHYSYKALINLLITMLAYVLLIVGLFFTMSSISSLFEFEIYSYYYTNTALFILGFIMPIIFLSLIPNKDIKDKYPSFINSMIIYIIFPILTVYTGVIYLYFIKILVTLKWPSNSLGNLTIYYLLGSVIVLYFTNKMKDINKWTKKFITIYPYSMIIPSIMMLITFIIRINEYGFTISRYYGLLVFIFVVISIYFIIKDNKVKYIPVTLAVLLLISNFGPLSAFNVTKMSQKSRFIDVLNDNNMIVNNKLVTNSNLTKEDEELLIDIITYFEINYDVKDLEYLPDNFNYSMFDTVFRGN